jgi:tetratricopeptide (TPR) repeat protein
MMKTMQQGNQANFGRRQACTQPTVAYMQRRSRLRYFVMLISLPIVAMLAVRLVTGKASFSYHVTFSGNEPNLSQLLDECGGKNGTTPNLQIAACSTLIESGRGNDRGLSVAFYDRGNAYQQKGDFDHGIADYDQAIKLNPNFTTAINNRAAAVAKRSH